MALPFLPPATMDSSFAMGRPTEADIDAMARVYYDSFATDPANTWWWPEDSDAMFEWLRERIRKKMKDRAVRHFQVVDDQGDIVAFARWDIPEGYEARFGEWIGIDDDTADVSRAMEEAPGNDDNGAEPLAVATAAPAEEPAAVNPMEGPRGADPELCRFFFRKLANLSKKWKANEMLGLSLLCTSPRYFRRGASKALLAPVLALADAAGLRTYLEATPAGRPVYEKLGFREVEAILLDPAPVSGGKVKGGSMLYIMIREPRPL